MSDEIVTIVEYTPIKKYKYCLIGVPDVGLVGAIALSYFIQEEQMIEAGYVESDAFPPVVVIHHGDIKPAVRLYSKGEIAAIVSEIPVEAELFPLVARSIVDWAKTKNVEVLITVSGIAVQNRLEIDVPAVFGVGTSSSTKNLLKNAGIEAFEEGFIVGFHAIMMNECLRKNVASMTLLAQSHLQYPDPGAAASVITSFNKLLGLKIDTKKLLDEEDEIRLKMRELMQRTQQQMRQTQKGREQEIPPMYV